MSSPTSLLATAMRARSEEGWENLKGCSCRRACNSDTDRQQKDCRTSTSLCSVRQRRSLACQRFAVHTVIIDCRYTSCASGVWHQQTDPLLVHERS
eukprot:1007143-Rhodomonas_salina.1